MVPCFTTSSTVMLDIFPTAVSTTIRSSRPEVFLRKVVLKICSKFTGGHPCRSVISIKLLCNFIEITLRHGCSPVNLLHIFRTPLPRNNSGWLLLNVPFKSRLKEIQITGQINAFCRQRIPEPRRARKEIVDIDILITYRNGDKKIKIMQPIRITSGLVTRKGKWNQFIQFR